MARTKLSVTKALKRKKLNLNESDVNENDSSVNTGKKVKITFPRTKALIKTKNKLLLVALPSQCLRDLRLTDLQLPEGWKF
jgi:hypothetical protein